jgi:hypothetical protein
MSESSAEKKPEGQEVPKAEAAEAKVPVSALAKERAEKRTARKEVEDLKQQLATKQDQQAPFDMDAFLGTLGQFVMEQSEAAAKSAVAPLQAEAEKFKTAVELGLNKDQAEAIAAVRDKFPGMTPEQAHVLARSEQPQLFPQSRTGAQPRLPTGLPPGGDSQVRNAPKQEDLVAKANELKAKGDRKGAMEVARQDLANRVAAIFKLNKP